MSCQRL